MKKEAPTPPPNPPPPRLAGLTHEHSWMPLGIHVSQPDRTIQPLAVHAYMMCACGAVLSKVV